jgi:hypothetical protein
MAKIPVHVKKDHIEALVATKSPMVSVAELVWNGFDADANTVAVRFEHNGLGGLECIRVQDDGSGLSFDDSQALFGNLGGSWKSEKRRTATGRSLHGKSGKGRFRAFALGSLVAWKTQSKRNEQTISFKVHGSSENLEAFELDDPKEIASETTGTEVIISNIHKNFTSLTDEDAPQRIAKYFAVYLAEYPGLTIDYNGVIVDPTVAQQHKADYPLGEVAISGGRMVPAELTIIEWNEPQGRSLHLCDAQGISLHEMPPGIQAPGFTFSAYLKSDYLRELDKEGVLTLEDLHADVIALVAAAKGKMKEHFRAREAEDAQALVREWKEQKIYPYEGEPKDPLETAERQVFDVVAVNLNAYLEDFDEGTDTSKRFTFKLVKQALKENPESLQLIFEDVLKLPKDRQDDLADLLKKTSLTAIISSAKLVADRLNFLRGLEILLFDKDSKEQLLERDQLHKILAQETWIFGENFHLTSNEDTLEEVLAKYLERLGKRIDDEEEVAPVEREHGKGGRIDLMLARTVPQPRADVWEHLVVELKRPAKKIDDTVIGQIKSYAIAVAKDERFRDTKTRCIFWVISNEMTDEARRDARQRGRAEGIVFDDSELNITVWAKTWGQLIQDCKGRLNFFKKHLDYEADRESAKEYLQKAHEKYLPTTVQSSENQSAAAAPPHPATK